jgi:hypothetical protein
MEAKLGRPFLTAPHVSLPPTVAEALRTVVSREELGARPVALAERY